MNKKSQEKSHKKSVKTTKTTKTQKKNNIFSDNVLENQILFHETKKERDIIENQCKDINLQEKLGENFSVGNITLSNDLKNEKDEKKPLTPDFIEKVIKEDSKETLPIIEKKMSLIDGGIYYDGTVKDQSAYQTEREARRKWRLENPMSVIVDGVIKARRPIQNYSREKFDLDTPEAARIRENYGQDNYIHSVSALNSASSHNFQAIDIGIPDVDVKLMDNEKIETANAIEDSKFFYEKNKQQMQQQMNVVAFYSIKDAKPFYYVSSAEARLAIDYINLCRKYKKDIFKFNVETITECVGKIDDIIVKIKMSNLPLNKDDKNFNIKKSLVWKSVYENEINEVDDYNQYGKILDAEKYINIKSIYKQAYLPYTHENRSVILNEFDVVVDTLDVYSLKNIIDLHALISIETNGYSSFIIGNKELTNNLIVSYISSSSGLPVIDVTNVTEKEIFGMIGKYKGKPIFANDKIKDNTFVILSRNVDNGNIIVSEYNIIPQKTNWVK